MDAKLRTSIFLCLVTFTGVLAWRQQLYEGDICAPNTKCVSFRNCSLLQDEKLRWRLPICGYNGREAIVCCSDSLIDKTFEDSKFLSASDYKRPKLVSVCEKYKNEICAGNDSTELSQFDLERNLPFLVLIGYGTKRNITWNCGGALISDHYIITAAHCINIPKLGNAKWIKLNNLNETYMVDGSAVHPNYQPPMRYNDIALLKLLNRTQFGPSVRPLCLPHPPYNDYTEYYSVRGGGWGHSDKGNEPKPGSGLLKVIEPGRCSLAGEPHELPMGTDSEAIICVSHTGKNRKKCTNHFGGSALFISDNIGFSDESCYLGTLIGILSVGKECEERNFPGVYTNISFYMPWLMPKVFPDNTTYSELYWPPKKIVEKKDKNNN